MIYLVGVFFLLVLSMLELHFVCGRRRHDVYVTHHSQRDRRLSHLNLSSRDF